MRCDNCYHKPICVHYSNIRNDTYARMGYRFSPDECEDHVNADNVAPVVHGQIIWKERNRGGFKTAKCLHYFNDVNTENNIPCKHIAKIDERYTINEPYCSKCGKLLGDFLNYCGNCGVKMDEKEEN